MTCTASLIKIFALIFRCPAYAVHVTGSLPGVYIWISIPDLIEYNFKRCFEILTYPYKSPLSIALHWYNLVLAGWLSVYRISVSVIGMYFWLSSLHFSHPSSDCSCLDQLDCTTATNYRIYISHTWAHPPKLLYSIDFVFFLSVRQYSNQVLLMIFQDIHRSISHSLPLTLCDLLASTSWLL